MELNDKDSEKMVGEVEFQLGQIVTLVSNAEISGAIVRVIPGDPESRYEVFIDGKTKLFYASQLQAKEGGADELKIVPLAQFHAYLSALQIKHPGLSTLYSLNSARVEYIPYQFRPVLKFIRSDTPRLLVADGVGVGKTIEAGLILRELQARQDVRSVLIICPRPLVIERKWELEMRRFDERFTHLDGKTLRYCIDEYDMEGYWPDPHAKTILSYSLFDEVMLYGTSSTGKSRRKLQRKGLLDMNPPPRFDLVIVDEAHHIRNTDTFVHKGVRFFCENAEAVIFLTATPIQLGSHDLFVLLNVLRPDLVLDKESFEHMAAPNPYINRAVDAARAAKVTWQKDAISELMEASTTEWGRKMLMNDPEFKRVCNTLESGVLSPEERVALINDLEQMHTFSGIINRTRRRDIGEFTIRKPVTVTIEFTPEQRKLHDDLLEAQAAIMSRLHSKTNLKFLMTTIRRQAASCLYGLAPLLEDILTRRIDELVWDEMNGDAEIQGMDSIDEIEGQILHVLDQAEKLDPKDPKLDALVKIIIDKRDMANNRVMVFSSFRHTLRYINGHLNAQGVRVGVVHGGTPDEERIQMRNRFQLNKDDEEALDVLLFSEIGCEGLDYQFCDCIVNYDLPWNPMRVEQRIGRIDRRGQKSESVLIYNLIVPGTVDADIYERCLLRIGVFNSALGAGEEILGQVTKEIQNVAMDINLSDSDRAEKFQQIADNEIRYIQEQNKLEDKQAELFGIRLPSDQTQKDIDSATSYWLSSIAVENMVNLYLQRIAKKEQEYILGDKDLKTLRLSQDTRNQLLIDFQKLPRHASRVNKQWEQWLKGGSPHLSVTFESVCAADNMDAMFITPLHPLVKQAAAEIEPEGKVVTALEVWSDSVSPGKYPFAIYQWQYHGIRKDLVLYPVCGSPALIPHLSDFLENGRSTSLDESSIPNREIFEELDQQHYGLWSKARSEHQDRTRRIAEFRKESLKTSHNARITILHEQLEHATDDKIQRMRQSQIDSAEADYGRRLQALKEALTKTDITAEIVAWGALRINQEAKNEQ